jgi:hypothetical protein
MLLATTSTSSSYLYIYVYDGWIRSRGGAYGSRDMYIPRCLCHRCLSFGYPAGRPMMGSAEQITVPSSSREAGCSMSHTSDPDGSCRLSDELTSCLVEKETNICHKNYEFLRRSWSIASSRSARLTSGEFVGLLLCSRARRVNLLGKVVTTYHSDEQEISCTRPLVDSFSPEKKQ